jgi:hypothetical protein
MFVGVSNRRGPERPRSGARESTLAGVVIDF